MDQRRISVNDVSVGEPLPWDVYDANNRLLLRRGQVLSHSQQIETLVARGIFVDVKQGQGGRADAIAQQPKETPSVLRLVNLANKRLEKLLFGLQTEADLQAKILEVAELIRYATRLNSDIALACILLNQAAAPYTVRHAIDTAIVSYLISKSLGKTPEEVEAIMAASLTMNVGMMRVHEQFQQKAEALDSKDLAVIRSHPEESVQMLQAAGITNEKWLSYVLLHHENEDGTGYPFGKSKDDIPQNAKIIALADRYSARVSSRIYRKPLLPNAALRDILMNDKDTIDTQLAACFIRELGIYPTGTLVQLQNGEIGVVTGKGSSSTTPVVHSLIAPRGAPLSFAIKRDTTKELYSIRDVLHPDRAAIRFSMHQLWGAEAAL